MAITDDNLVVDQTVVGLTTCMHVGVRNVICVSVVALLVPTLTVAHSQDCQCAMNDQKILMDTLSGILYSLEITPPFSLIRFTYKYGEAYN